MRSFDLSVVVRACWYIGLLQKLEVPPQKRRQVYFKLKTWEFSGSNFDLKKLGF